MHNFKISPINNKHPFLPLVFSFNNDYSKYFSVALKSLIENSNKQLFYDIVVFSSDINARNKKLLRDILPENFSLRFFNISDYISNLLQDINLVTMKYWSVEMYYRIVIPLIMPDYQKVLYADSDIVFNTDISSIYNIAFEGNKLLAISDSFNLVSCLEASKERNLYLKETLELGKHDIYFNSGVLVFNIPAFKPEKYLDRIKTAFNRVKKTYCPDQDILNFIFKGNVKIIEQKWNLQYHLPIFHKKDLSYINKALLEEYNEAFSLPSIIHYTSPVKPWNAPQEELSEVFWKYARQTVFYEEILSGMYKNEIFESRYATNLYLMLQNNKKVIFWGASLYLENFLKKYEINKKFYPNIIGIIDKNSTRTGSFLGDYEIFTPEILKHCDAEEIILTVINSLNERYEEVKNYLKEHNINIKLTRL